MPTSQLPSNISFIRSSSHSLKFSNSSKLSSLNLILSEYRRIAALISHHLFTHGFSDKNNKLTFLPSKNLFNLPSFPPASFSNLFASSSFFGSSFLNNLCNNVFSLVKTHISSINLRLSKLDLKINSLIWQLDSPLPTSNIQNIQKKEKLLLKLQNQRNEIKFTEPNTSNLPLKLSYNQLDFQFSNNTLWNKVPQNLKIPKDSEAQKKAEKAEKKTSFDVFVRIRAILGHSKTFNSSFISDPEFIKLYENKQILLKGSPKPITSLTKEDFYTNFKFINLPIKSHSVFNDWIKQGNLSLFAEINQTSLKFCFTCSNNLKTVGVAVGADQGFKTTLSLSSGSNNIFEYQTPKFNSHNHSLESICETLSKKKKGSKAFRRVQIQRRNFINEQINEIDFSPIREIRLEKIKNLRVGKKQFVSKMIHWSYPLIKQKLNGVSERQGLTFTEVPNSYNSQRCNVCEWVQKDNRKGEVFDCRKCPNKANADINAARNLCLDLYPLDFKEIRRIKIGLKLKGFYWNSGGINDEDGVLVELESLKQGGSRGKNKTSINTPSNPKRLNGADVKSTPINSICYEVRFPINSIM